MPGVPAEAVAVVGNLTIHSTHGGGYVSVYPGGAPAPATSNINWGSSGETIANAVTVGLGPNYSVTLFADATVSRGSPATHVILDVAAYVL